jgi:hypothetical protein
MLNMVHIVDTSAQDGEGICVWLLNEATKRATQNERQRRSKVHKKYILQNAMQNVVQNVM